MRYIAGQTPGYDKVEVYLDGEKLDFCFEADDELGKAWVNDVINGVIQDTYTVKRGKVEFIERKDYKPIAMTKETNLSSISELVDILKKGGIFTT